MSTSPFHEQACDSYLVSEGEIRDATKQERNKILAADVARLLELSTAQTLNYIDLVTAVGRSEGDAGVRSRLKADFVAAGIAVSDGRLRLCMDALMVEAWQAMRLRDCGGVPALERPTAARRGCTAPSLVFSLSIGQPGRAVMPSGSGRLN